MYTLCHQEAIFAISQHLTTTDLFTNHGRPLYRNALGRWMDVGPYYAMFPMQFAFKVIDQDLTSDGVVLDPFAGRASSVYAATALERGGTGIEINPVGYLYGKVKLQPATESRVLGDLATVSLTVKLSNSDRAVGFQIARG